MQNMGKRIAEARQKCGMTQAELAAKMNVTDKAVSKWERGISRPDIDSIPRLAECLSMSTEELFGSTGTKEVPEKNEDILSLILTGIPLAMGISVAVLNLLNQIEARDSFILIGIGLASLALHAFLKNK
ncbi:MAG: helix-turn-helix transcriptional regulator [Clostridiales bacterium]|nr:helix-turn-helix transcriptional regulator [Clostridiales bacterium]